MSKQISALTMPAVTGYTLRGNIFTGTEIPTGGSTLAKVITKVQEKVRRSFHKMSIRLCMGPLCLQTNRSPCVHGEVTWIQPLEESIIFPEDFFQLPDVFVYLNRGKVAEDNLNDEDNICFARFRAIDLLRDESNRDISFVAMAQPKWFHFVEDETVDNLTDHEFPGSLLMQLGFGSTHLSGTRPWNPSLFNILDPKILENYQVRVHVYQVCNWHASN